MSGKPPPVVSHLPSVANLVIPTTMEIYDIIMLAVIAAATIFGAIKGFAWQLASIGSISLSYVAAYQFRDALAQKIDTPQPWNRFLAMLILFVVTSLMVWSMFRLARSWIDRMQLRDFDHHVGAVFGLIKGGLYCTLATLFAVTLAGETVRQAVASSRSGHAIARTLAGSEALIPPEVHEFIEPYLDQFDATMSTPQATIASLPAAVDR